MLTVTQIAERARAAKDAMAALGTEQKNRALCAIADALDAHKEDIVKANAADLAAGRENGMREVMLDRLTLNAARIQDVAEGCRQVALLEDPVGEVTNMKTRPNGLKIGAKRVPMGVIGIIYEARPNVTVDAAALCFKAGSCCVLRGGKEAFLTNSCLMEIMRDALKKAGAPQDAMNLVEDTSRQSATQMMRANGLIDVLIPRGGAGLIRTVVENASVPVIQTGTGNCHIYVERSANTEMALDILENAKCSRPSVCNAAESLLVDESIAASFLPAAKKRLDAKGVVLHCCKESALILGDGVLPATEDDFGKEYLGFELSVKVVSGLDEAVKHINRYGTGHSEAIVTRDYFAAQRFLDLVDAAAVYVNASTRFTDGNAFGFGAEIGISTQKLHARGPMGLKELTTIKYIIYGEGQIR